MTGEQIAGATMYALDAMVAADIHGLTITEIATRDGVTRTTVYKRLRMGR